MPDPLRAYAPVRSAAIHAGLALAMIAPAASASAHPATSSAPAARPSAAVRSAGGAARAPAAPAARQDTLRLDPAVRTGVLPNGLHYYVRANRRPEQRAELRLVVHAGSILEDPDQRGLAHFVEHMAFNGTRNFPKQELVAYLESIGTRFGADLNAYTGFDETVYMLQVPTDTGSYLERGLAILEDWAHGQIFDAEEIEKERGVVIEEWRLGRGAGARMSDEMLPILLAGSRYAERLPIGTREVLESFQPDALRRFYSDWYRPDLMAVIAVGDFDAAGVERMIRERFSSIAAPAAPQPRPSYPVPDHEETLVATATDPEATGSSVSVFYKLPDQPVRTDTDYQRALAGRLHYGMLNARLSELAQKADPPFVAAIASRSSLFGVKDVYVIGADVAEGGVLRGLDAVLTEAERVARHGFTASELERQKASMLRAYEQAHIERENTFSSAYAAEYIAHFLRGDPSPGIEVEYALVQRFLPGIAIGEVEAFAREWMRDANRVIVAQAPERAGAGVPDDAPLLAAFDRVRNAEIAAYTDDVADGALVDRTPQPGRILEERAIPDIGATEWRLDNGVRVLIKPTDFQDDEILFGATSPGGLSQFADSLIVDARLAVTTIGSSGVGAMNLVQLQKALAGKVASVSPGLSELSESLGGRASTADIETLLQLVYLYFTAPRTDVQALESLRDRLQAALTQQAADPAAAFGDTLTLTLAQHHPRVRLMKPETLDEWDFDNAFALYRDRFADAGDFTFVFVGNIDPATLRPLVEQWIASLPATGRSERAIDRGVRPPDAVIEKIVRKGVEPKAQTTLVFTGPFQYNRRNSYILGALGEALDVRLREVLREDLGGTYGAGVSASTAREPWQNFRVTISFGSAPDRADELTRTVFDEIQKLRSQGPDSTTLANIKEKHRRAYETNLRENGFWLGQILTAVQLGTEFRAINEFPALVDSLTAQDLRDAARLLSDNRYVRVSLLPEAG